MWPHDPVNSDGCESVETWLVSAGRDRTPGAPTADSLTEALSHTIQPDVAARARAVAASVRTDGAEIAARRLIGEVTRTAFGN